MVTSRQFASLGLACTGAVAGLEPKVMSDYAQGVDLQDMFFWRLLKKIVLLIPAKNSAGDFPTPKKHLFLTL